MNLLRILLVDDNNEFRNSEFNFIKTQINFESLNWVSTKESVLVKIETIQPSLILVDKIFMNSFQNFLAGVPQIITDSG